MASELSRYEIACRAVAEAKTVDEVKQLRDKAEAMRAYARQAKNRDLEADASEIRLRAERRLGEMLIASPRHEGGRPAKTRSVEEQVSEKPKLAEAGIDRKLSMRAQKLAAVPETQFEGMLGQHRQRIVDEGERVSMDLLKAGDKAQRRAEREAALADELEDLSQRLGHQVYGVIYADPPWRFEPYSRDTGMDRAADNHYATTELEGIAGLDVVSAAASDCVLFLWATAPMLPQALYVMQKWGFEYKSQIVWVKDKIGTGYWARNKHELLLIGTRGNIPAPSPGTQPESVQTGPVAEHSKKPEKFHELIEEMFPNLQKIELYARRPRNGWDVWGHETGNDE
jgi:N6-adenosine-specific RNA methylase IME4